MTSRVYSNSVTFLFSLFIVHTLSDSLICPNGNSPSSINLNWCVEYKTASCCSLSDELGLKLALDQVLNQTLYPVCYEDLRKTRCGLSCSQYASYYDPLNSNQTQKVCSSTCNSVSTACNWIYNQSNYFIDCTYAPKINCFGNNQIPARAYGSSDGLGSYSPTNLPISSALAIGLICGAILIGCGCLLMCASRQMKSGIKQKKNTQIDPQLQARILKAKAGYTKSEAEKMSPPEIRSPTHAWGETPVTAPAAAAAVAGGAGVTGGFQSGPTQGNSSNNLFIPIEASNDPNLNAYQSPRFSNSSHPYFDDATLSGIRYLCRVSGWSLVLPLIICGLLPFTDSFLNYVSISDWFGRITTLQTRVYIICACTLVLIFIGWSSGKSILRGTARTLFPIRVFIFICIIGWGTAGFFGYIAADDSFGRVYSITASSSSNPPEAGPGAVVTFIFIFICGTIIIFPQHAALKLLALEYPRKAKPEPPQ